MPNVRDDEYDVFVHSKKRYYQLHTDLDFFLVQHGVQRIYIAGVNRNSCVQCTCFEAGNRNFVVIVVGECVDSMDGEEYHHSALRNI